MKVSNWLWLPLKVTSHGEVSSFCALYILSPVVFSHILVFLEPKNMRNRVFRDVPDSSVGKETACIAGDPSSIPGLGRSSGEGIGYPLQHSWASLVAQLVKNWPAMWETWVRSLGWEDPLEKGKANPLQYSGLETFTDYSPGGSHKVGHNWMLSLICPELAFGLKHMLGSWETVIWLTLIFSSCSFWEQGRDRQTPTLCSRRHL